MSHRWLKRGRLASLEALRPVLGAIYRARRGACPAWLLRALAITTPDNDPRFATVARLLDDVSGGALIECGVAQGSSLMGMLHCLYRRGVTAVTVYACDSFRGFPEPTAHDAQPDGSLHPYVHRGAFKNTARWFVQWRLRMTGWPYRVQLVAGFFEHTLPTLGPQRFQFVHLDCDLYESYRVCLRELYPRLLPGGVMVFDEYEGPRARYPGSKRAIDEFLADKPETLECFPDVPKLRYFIRKV